MLIINVSKAQTQLLCVFVLRKLSKPHSLFIFQKHENSVLRKAIFSNIFAYQLKEKICKQRVQLPRKWFKKNNVNIHDTKHANTHRKTTPKPFAYVNRTHKKKYPYSIWKYSHYYRAAYIRRMLLLLLFKIISVSTRLQRTIKKTHTKNSLADSLG